MNASEAFQVLLSRIELNPTRVQGASQRYNAVKAQIESALPGKEVRQVGSFQRKTKIRPLDNSDALDIDALVCFGDALRYAPDGVTPSRALTIVQGGIEEDATYEAMDPQSDSPTIVLRYHDDFKIELIPCYRELTGKYPRSSGPACYIVGNGRGGWTPADYDYDAEFISSMNNNKLVNGQLVPSIKILKRFFRNRGIEVKSFFVELMCTLIVPLTIKNWQAEGLSWTYADILAKVIAQAPAYLGQSLQLPGSYSEPVDCGIQGGNLIPLRLQVQTASAQIRTLLAREFDASLWRDFYGDPFPGA